MEEIIAAQVPSKVNWYEQSEDDRLVQLLGNNHITINSSAITLTSALLFFKTSA